MNKNDIQSLKTQMNQIRRWFYLTAERELGVDITGIPLPHVEMSISGGFDAEPEVKYEYLELTLFDREQQKAKAQQGQYKSMGDAEPRIYLAMSRFFSAAVEYLEARQSQAGIWCTTAWVGVAKPLTRVGHDGKKSRTHLFRR